MKASKLLLASFMIAAPASGQEVCRCCDVGQTTALSYQVTFSWSATYTGDTCSPTPSPACVASAVGFAFSTSTQCGVEPTTYARTGVGTTGASASGAYSSAGSSATGDCGSGALGVSARSLVTVKQDYGGPQSEPCPCVYRGISVILGLGGAGAAMNCDLDGCTLVDYVPSLSVNTQINFTPINGNCCPTLGPGPFSNGSTGQDVKVRLIGHYSDESTRTSVIQGVFSASKSEVTPTTVRLGFLNAPAFVTSGSSSSATLTASSAALPFSLPLNPSPGVHLASVSADLTAVDFSTANSDFSPQESGTDRTCWNDRRLFVAALGSVLGDGVYAAKFDYDLDGDVDNDDLSNYCMLFNQNACAADYNCVGGVTVQDLFDFQADYFVASPNADFNCNGAVTVQDLFDFIAAYFTGC